MDRGRPEEALRVLEAAVSRRASAGLLAGRAEVLLRLGRVRGAVATSRAPCASRGDHRPAIALLSAAELLLGNGERTPGLRTRAARKAPQDEASWEALGLAALEEGRAEEARGAFDRTLGVEPESPSALAGIALAALEGKRPAAEIVPRLERALEAGPGHPLALLAAERLGKAKGDGAGAADLERKTIEKARERGELGWAAHIEERARGCGILPGATVE
jgi:tetratricopeptide (TPR) repeat protein